VVALLGMLAMRLKALHSHGSRYYVGDSLTAVDVYAATSMALFGPFLSLTNACHIYVKVPDLPFLIERINHHRVGDIGDTVACVAHPPMRASLYRSPASTPFFCGL
jgi:hypothetical protein